MNRDSRAHQVAVPGMQRERRIDAGAQVQARRSGRRVMRQHAADPLVEDLELEPPHFFCGSMPATCSTIFRASWSFAPLLSGGSPRPLSSNIQFVTVSIDSF